MNTTAIEFDYFYGMESQQFAFYRIPKMLVKDERFKKVSNDAKLLYGLLLDRMSLSQKNGWFDNKNRAYIIYTIDEIAEDLGIGHEKAGKILGALDSKKGIGLVERVRRGQGKPDIIYVKNFVLPEKKATIGQETSKDIAQKSENQISRDEHFSEIRKSDFLTSENQSSGNPNIRSLDIRKSDANYNIHNYTDMNYPDPIYQSTGDRMDVMDETAVYMKLIKDNIEYDHHMTYLKYGEKEIFEELYQIICEIVCVKRKTVQIAGEQYPYELVKSRFLKIDTTHVDYVMECMKKTTTKISNIKAYMLTALYNAPGTINHFYQQEVMHDLYGVG